MLVVLVKLLKIYHYFSILKFQWLLSHIIVLFTHSLNEKIREYWKRIKCSVGLNQF